MISLVPRPRFSPHRMNTSPSRNGDVPSDAVKIWVWARDKGMFNSSYPRIDRNVKLRVVAFVKIANFSGLLKLLLCTWTEYLLVWIQACLIEQETSAIQSWWDGVIWS